jgi:hypothetical protein
MDLQDHARVDLLPRLVVRKLRLVGTALAASRERHPSNFAGRGMARGAGRCGNHRRIRRRLVAESTPSASQPAADLEGGDPVAEQAQPESPTG